MRTLRLLFAAPAAAALIFGAVSFAQAPAGDNAPPPGTQQLAACVGTKCSPKFTDCQKDCKGRSACNAKCARALGKCAEEECGVVEPEKE